jgi:PAS domain S-box-containing protein
MARCSHLPMVPQLPKKRRAPRRQPTKSSEAMSHDLRQALALQRGESRAQAERWLDQASALQNVVDWYVHLFEALPIPYLVLDAKGVIVEINPAAAQLLDVAQHHTTKKPLLAHVHRGDTKLLFKHLQQCAEGSASTELRLRGSGDAPPRPVRLVSRRFHSRHPGTSEQIPDYAYYCYYTIIWDIGEDRRRDELLRLSEAHYREIVETANEGICITNDANEITFANRRFAAMVGFPVDELIGRSAMDLIAPAEAEAARHAFEQRDSGPRGQSEQRLLRADGTELLTSVSTTVLRAQEGRFAGMLRMYTDATLRQYVAEARDLMVREMVAAQERERQRVARELHDQMGQHVVALTLGLARLASVEHLGPDAASIVEHLRGVADLLGRDAHTLAMELRPSALDHLGLAVALTSYAEALAGRSQLDIDVHCDSLETLQLNATLETGIYRIAQEALTNIVKHAQARRVSVILEHRGNTLQLIIEDDGVGFDQFARRQPSMLGLSGMNERVALLGGTLTIETSPGNGTTIFARIPIGIPELEDHEQTPKTAAG